MGLGEIPICTLLVSLWLGHYSSDSEVLLVDRWSPDAPQPAFTLPPLYTYLYEYEGSGSCLGLPCRFVGAARSRPDRNEPIRRRQSPHPAKLSDESEIFDIGVVQVGEFEFRCQSSRAQDVS